MRCILVLLGSETDGLMLDGQPLPALNWNSVSGTDYLGATMRIEPGMFSHSQPGHLRMPCLVELYFLILTWNAYWTCL